MIKVLVITYYWPPAGGPGVQRVLKFVKYFPEFDIIPVVLTISKGDYPAIDETLLEEVPGSLKVYSTKGWEPYRFFRKFTGMASNKTIPVGILAKDPGNKYRLRLANWCRLNLFIPDARRYIIRPFVSKAKEIIEKEGIDVILTSSPPHSIQLIGLKLKQELNLPWIGDFRDPWTNISYYQKVKRSKYALKKDQGLEREVVDSVDILVAVNQSIIDDYKKRFQPRETAKILNGYDESDFMDIPVRSLNDTGEHTILYYGSLMEDQVIPEFIEAISNVAEILRGRGELLKMKFIGNIHDRIKYLLREVNYKDVEFVNYKPHKDLLLEASSASMLLFIVNRVRDNRGILTGKLFEYLALGIPILGIGPVDSEAGGILRETGRGTMVDYKNIKSMEDYILRNITSKNSFDSDDTISKYSRRAQTQQLAELIHTINRSHKHK